MTIVQDILPTVTTLAAGIDWFSIAKAAFYLAAAVCILGCLLRLVFGKGSSLVRSVSACLSVALIYIADILIFKFIPSLRRSIASLPFLSIDADAFYLWDIASLPAASLYPALLQSFLLAFLVNLLETLLPHGKKFVSWYFLRLLTVIAALGVYSLISGLILSFAPEVYGALAGWILVGIWAFIGLLGIAKWLMALAVAVINPVLGALFAFFFSNSFGKQFTKAILTTLLTLVIFIVLYSMGFTGFVFDSFTLASYGPSCLIAMAALYLFGKLL